MGNSNSTKKRDRDDDSDSESDYSNNTNIIKHVKKEKTAFEKFLDEAESTDYNINICKQLLTEEVYSLIDDDNLDTLLHFAIINNHPSDVLELICKFKPKSEIYIHNFKNRDDHTALSLAVKDNNKKAVKILCKYVDVNIKIKGHSILNYKYSEYNEEIIYYLFDAGLKLPLNTIIEYITKICYKDNKYFMSVVSDLIRNDMN